ncbi:MoxR-like ATPase [Hahella chejuensis KCTC 2396]|uniref:MoxR-like ATPase n=1 Tax=Hahella chejuensis (strain KCTC 2396) TaxID=349521 RepID=Q2SD00_HAHCH|nr:MoxR family ATPase [Hahella chejuensis]ABC31474.1 MoxR-like ATPase [Hahella chejuensis KCTC 2396]
MSLQATLLDLKNQLSESIIGQSHLLDRLLISLLADGHLLVEGAPGLAKTKAIKELASNIEGDFQRIQFTPDLLPADITGSDIYRPETGNFEFRKGPIFHNLVLADEINRAPAKVQSALLEAMAERQVTVSGRSYPLNGLFMVMATQNPIEQEGTYPLPEAQLDRFLLHVRIDYPDSESELSILRLARHEAAGPKVKEAQPLEQEAIFQARKEVLDVYMADSVEQYIVQIIMATRFPEKYDAKLAEWLEYGGSPRATIALDRCARAHAWLNGKDFVAPEDVQAMAFDVLRHRLITSFKAEAEGVSTDKVIARLLEQVPVP